MFSLYLHVLFLGTPFHGLQVLPQSRDMHGVRLIADYKWAIGMNMSLSDSLSLCVFPGTDW